MSRFNVVSEIPRVFWLKVEAQSTLSGTFLTPHNKLIKIFKILDGSYKMGTIQNQWYQSNLYFTELASQS